MPKCKVCDSDFETFVDFGQMPIANAFKAKDELLDEYTFHMEVGFCGSCKMVQLAEQPDRDMMFHDQYAFYSSTSTYMENHFFEFAETTINQQRLNKDSYVVEIGCNDGIMLKNFVSKGVPCLGIEPSKNVADVARQKGIEVISEFFDDELVERIIEEQSKADAILSANVMCHVPYINSIFNGVSKLLKDDGVFIFEDPYLGEVIEKTSFDQIYDEHVFLFSALSVNQLSARHGLELIDVSPQVTHGGSMRYTIGHKGRKKVSSRVNELFEKEINLGLDDGSAYLNFASNVDKIKTDLLRLLSRLKAEGKKVVGYGATSKSTTVINYCGISSDLIECIFDTTPIKQNKLSPGAHIPIVPYEKFHSSNPDYVLLFAWNHATEIMEKEVEYMSGERSWISYVPKVAVT